MVEFKFKRERERCKRKIEKECVREGEREKELYRFAHTNRHSQELPEMTEISTFFIHNFGKKLPKCTIQHLAAFSIIRLLL